MKRKKVVVTREIRIEREDEKMTITLANAKTEGRTIYFSEDWKCSKGNLEVMIQSYIANEAINGATVFIDERLVDEFTAITDSPYKGEFKLVYIDKHGQPVKASEVQEPPAAVDATPYHVEITMFGNKVPLFEIRCNDYLLHNIKNGNIAWRKKEVDDWLISLYQRRKQYSQVSIEIPRVVAALYLDSLSCNPRIVRELNINLTTEQSRAVDIVA